MVTAPEITYNRNYYLERFTRFEYPNAFEKFKSECAPLFETLDEYGVSKAVDELIGYAAEQSQGLFRKNIELDKFCRLFALFIVPAAIEEGKNEFAQELCEAWNEKYPKCKFSIGTYQEISSGFRTKPFGMG